MSTFTRTAEGNLERDRTGRFLESRGIERSVLTMIGGVILMAWLMTTAVGHNGPDDAAPETAPVEAVQTDQPAPAIGLSD